MILFVLAAALAFTPDGKDPRQRMLGALADELSRAQKGLQIRGHETPYYLGYSVRGIDAEEIGAKYGALFLDHARHDKRMQVDVRVGSYQLDNSTQQDVYDFDSADSGYTAGREGPLDDDELALRNAL